MKNRFDEKIHLSFEVSPASVLTWIKRYLVEAQAHGDSDVLTCHKGLYDIDDYAMYKLVARRYRASWTDEGDIQDIIVRASNWFYKKVGQPDSVMSVKSLDGILD